MFTKKDNNGTWHCRWITRHGGQGVAPLWAEGKLLIELYNLRTGEQRSHKPNRMDMGWPKSDVPRNPGSSPGWVVVSTCDQAIIKAMFTSRREILLRRINRE